MNHPRDTTLSTPSAAPQRPSLRRKWWFKPLALLLALTVSFLVGETAVRLLYGAPLEEHEPLLMIQANPHTGWMMLPDTPHYMYHHRVQVNSLGLRGTEVTAKLEGDCRVLALGDSMIYGQGVADDETLPFYMEAALNRGAGSAGSDRSFTVINGGLRGFSTNQELGLLTELGPTLRPDVVVLFYYSNDILEHDIANTCRNLLKSGPVTFDTKTRLEGWDRVKWQVRKIVRRSALLMWLHDLLRGGGDGPTDREIADGIRRFQGYLNQMKAMGQTNGFDLVVAIIPDPNQLRGTHLTQQIDDRAAAACEAAGVPVVRLLDAARSADDGGRRLPVVPYDGHYLPQVNRAMAEKVAEAVRSRVDDKTPRGNW